MTLDEFRTLKPGDRIRNAMTDSAGAIASVENYRGKVIVEVQWDGTSMVLGSVPEHSTAWMHWTLDGADETSTAHHPV